jgi:hypothetical protein
VKTYWQGKNVRMHRERVIIDGRVKMHWQSENILTGTNAQAGR